MRALARAITLVERRDPGVRELEEALRTGAKSPGVAGFTGAPGTGKSTLVDAVIAFLRNQGSSGARGHLGGLSLATREAIRLLGAFGFDQVILETVGVGQSELEVAAVADTTVVVLTPNLGDSVQMIKAGILEIADVFAVNKSDIDGHARVVAELRTMMNMAPKTPWRPPIVPTIATRGDGVDKLWEAVLQHRRHLESSGMAAELAAQRLRDETAEVAAELARDRTRRALEEDAGLAERLLRDGTPYRTAEEILDRTDN